MGLATLITYERIIINFAAALAALAVSYRIFRSEGAQDHSLGISTCVLVALLLLYYHFRVQDPAHGVGILILPLGTGWLWWRQRHAGRPAFSNSVFLLAQLAYALLYIMAVWLQEA